VCERASVRESEVECVRQRGKEKLYEIERERERERERKRERELY
jgi:hypothetical protein